MKCSKGFFILMIIVFTTVLHALSYAESTPENVRGISFGNETYVLTGQGCIYISKDLANYVK
jgi:hypothetical protein